MDGPKDLEFYLQNFSSVELPLGVPEKRDTVRERKAFDHYLSSLNSHWVDFIELLSSTHPPMSPSVRAVVLVPARLEALRIERFLKALEKDLGELARCDSPFLELFILNNKRCEEQWDKTYEVIEAYRAERESTFPILYFEHVWDPDERYHLALGRKILADVALYRAVRHTSAEGPLYLFSEDADVECIDAGRTAAMVLFLDAHPELDALRGTQDRTRWALAKNQLLLLERRSWFFTECQLSAKFLWPANWEGANFYWNRVVTGGWNTCFSAETYAMIRGYTPSVRIFEDMDIGQRISVLRGSWRSKRFIPDVSTIRRFPYRAESSAARAILSLCKNRHIYDAHNDYEFFFKCSSEALVRKEKLSDLLQSLSDFAEINSENKYRFEEVLSDLWREVLRILSCRERAFRIFKRTIFLLGFQNDDFILCDDHVVLLRLNKYRENARKFASAS